MKRLFTFVILVGSLVINSNQTQAQCYSAIELDGVNDYLHTPFSNYNFANYTIEMWIKSANYNAVEMYAHFNQDSQVALGSNLSLDAYFSGATGLNPNLITSGSGSLQPVGTWHHVALVYDGSNQIIYVDGAVAASVPTSGALAQGNGANFGLAIGARFDGSQQFANAAFEDVRIWTLARTSAELNANMSTNLSGSETGLVAYYRFEDGAGSSTVTDLTGNGNTLTLMNMDPATDWVSGLFSVDPQATDVQTACDSYTWVDGNTYTANNNTASYTYTGGAAGGCDSIVTLDLTVNASSQLTDTQTACDSYTWLDGNTYTASNNTAVYVDAGAAANGCDNIITLDLIVNNSEQVTDVQSECDSYTWIDGNTYTASNNTATYLVPGGTVSGCDSLVTLDLTINTVDPSATLFFSTFTATEAGAQYQWVDCDNNFAAIPGETNQTFEATADGNYAVIVTGGGGCSDTSSCIALVGASLNEFNFGNSLTVSPNPTNGVFSISSLNYTGEVKIEVVDVTGKVIFSSMKNVGPNSSATIDLDNAANGVYIVHVSDVNDSHSMRVIKK